MFESDVRRQWLAAISVNILQVSLGTSIGWPSCNLLVLQSKETPLPTGPLNVEQISWVGSLLQFSSIFGVALFGWLSDRYGRKWSLIASAVPILLGWLLIIFARNPMYLYASRFLSGLTSGATFVILPVFVVEIADTRIRGSLGSLLMLSFNLGMLISFIVGYYCSYIMGPLLMIVLPVLFLICMPFFPDTPQFLMRNGREKQAQKAYCFYRNIDWHSKDELSLLKDEMDKLKGATEQTDANTPVAKITWRDFVTPWARKAILIGLTLLALKQFSGIYAMLNYAGQIFQEAGSKMNPNLCAIVLGCIQLAGTYMPTLLVDRAGRKLILISSLVGTGIGLLVLGTYMYLKSIGYDLNGFTWIPLASFSFVLFVGCGGLVPIPFIIISEIMPSEIRSAGSSLCIGALALYTFIMFKCFPIMALTLGMHGSFVLFAGVTFFGAAFVFFVVPETKGKSFEEIMRLMKG